MATYYPLHHKALVWPLSALLVLKRLAYSAILKRAKLNTLSTCRMFIGFGTDKTIESHHKILKHLLCNPHGYWSAGHSYLTYMHKNQQETMQLITIRMKGKWHE